MGTGIRVLGLGGLAGLWFRFTWFRFALVAKRLVLLLTLSFAVFVGGGGRWFWLGS